MKVLLTGSTGLLGKAFVRELNSRDASYLAPSSEALDLLNFDATDKFIAIEKPDFIIHCAAYTAVDLAETEQDECWALNVTVLENLVKYKIPIIHFSSDYVFEAWLEKDGNFFVIPPDYPRAPLNFYGESKVGAEEVLANSDIDYWNIRTTWLYGPDGEGFPNKIKDLSRGEGVGGRVPVVNDQYGRKTLTTDLVNFVLDQIVLPLDKGGWGDLVNKPPKSPLSGGLNCGNHHFQSPGPIHTWCDWAVELLGEDKVTPVSAKDLDLPAKRPENSILI